MTLRTLSLAATGLALFSFGCSDAPARPAKVGMYVLIRNPEPSVAPGRSCPASSGIEWDIGKTLKENGVIIGVDSPRSTDFGTTLENGKSNAKIDCTVRKSGAFLATGEGVDPQIMPSGLLTFNLSGTAKPKGTPATNTVTTSLFTSVTFGIRSTPGFPECSITAVHEQAPGALWADFDCPALAEPTEPNKACHASGTMVFEYCSTGEEDE